MVHQQQRGLGPLAASDPEPIANGFVAGMSRSQLGACGGHLADDSQREVQIEMAVGDFARVTQLLGETEPFLVGRHGGRAVAQPVRDGAEGFERPDPVLRVGFGRLEREKPLRPRQPFAKVLPTLPHAPRRAADPEAEIHLARIRGPFERREDVADLRFRGADLAGSQSCRSGDRLEQLRAPLGVAMMDRRVLAAVVEPLDRELADGLEQAIADRAGCAIALDKGMADELVEDTEHVADPGRRIVHRIGDADPLDRPGPGATAEHAQSAEQDRFLRAEELVTPRERRAKCPVAIRRVARPGRQQGQAAIEPPRDLVDPQPAHARGRELDRQRQTVEPRADEGNGRGILGGRDEVGHDARHAIDEELGRVGLDGARQAEGRHRIEVLARQPKLRLAGGDDRQARGAGEQLGQQRRRVEHVLEVVEDEQALPGPEVIGQNGRGWLAADLSHPDRRGDRGRDLSRIGDGRQPDEPGTVAKVGRHLRCRLDDQSRLPGAGRTDQRHQPGRSKQLADGIRLPLPPDERGEGDGNVADDTVDRPKWRELDWQPRDEHLIQLLLGGQVLEPVAAEVPELDPCREIALDQRPGRLGDDDLATVRSRTDPRRPVDVHPDVIATDDPRLSRVHADADPDVHAFRPAGARETQLAFCHSGNRGRRIAEHDEERVAFGPHLDSVVAAERTAKGSPVEAEDVLPGRAKLVDEARRALDVREDEGDSSRGGTLRAGGHGDRS